MPSSTSANAVALAVSSPVVVLLNIVPLLLVFRVRNVAGCMLILTILVINLITLTNVLIWPNDNWDRWYNGVGLCDVQVYLRTALYTLIASSLCSITRSLARALDTNNATLHESIAQRRRRWTLDLLFCCGIPVLQIALRYVVAASRFAIYPVYGCFTFFDASWPTMVIMYIWPLLFGLLNCYYAGT